MNNNNNNTPSSDVCAVCLAATTVRGGEFLTSPGCCGKWFHQSCILELQKNGKNFCPACMAPFPAAPVLPFGARNAHPQPVPVFGPPPPPVSGFSNQAPPQYGFGAPPQQPIAFGAPPQQPIPFGAPQPPSFAFGNYGPPRSPFPPQHIAQQQQQQLFGNFGHYRPDPTPTINYDTSEDEISSEPIKTDKTVKKVDAPINDQLTITLSPEFAEENLDEKFPFHVRVSTTFNATSAVVEQKTDLDVVCVLDNSGSMSGSKIDNLKAAMEFVISTLGEKDRLSVVTFNSYPTTIQGLWKMTEARKNQSRNIVRAISAGGGTDIYSGMQQGWNMLQQRRTRNPASCMFLLTDGQDGSNLEQKKQLAKTMREQGTALFVFGFGNDHDSAHLIQIANAAEGSFVYVETNDTVIDAFGGAIGTQQGQLLRDIRVNITAGSPNVRIENIQAGSYLSNIGTDRRHALVNFADLYGGERRDFLVQLRLPAIPSAADLYDILSVQAVYRQHGNDAEEFTSPTSNCAIKRVTNDIYTQTVHERDVEVDVQIQRLAATANLKSAMELADRSNYEEAKNVLKNAKEQLVTSIANNKSHPMIATLLDDIKDCESKVSSRTEYETSGGRAYMTENMNMHTQQRVVYSKKAAAPTSYQSSVSRTKQSEALVFKSKR